MNPLSLFLSRKLFICPFFIKQQEFSLLSTTLEQKKPRRGRLRSVGSMMHFGEPLVASECLACRAGDQKVLLEVRLEQKLGARSWGKGVRVAYMPN